MFCDYLVWAAAVALRWVLFGFWICSVFVVAFWIAWFVWWLALDFLRFRRVGCLLGFAGFGFCGCCGCSGLVFCVVQVLVLGVVWGLLPVVGLGCVGLFFGWVWRFSVFFGVGCSWGDLVALVLAVINALFGLRVVGFGVCLIAA